MKLNKTYVIGCHVMWYELEMIPEYIESCVQMLEGIENPENVTFDFCINLQQHFELVDWKALDEKYHLYGDSIGNLEWLLTNQTDKLRKTGADYKYTTKFPNDVFYNIADARRDLNYNYCKQVDYILWSECDSLWAKQTLQIIEGIAEHSISPKHVISFAYRKNWDDSWDNLTHPNYRNVLYKEEDVLTAEWSEKSYMSLERMNEINNVESINITTFNTPKFDGSCLVISSELVKSGVNIPHSLLLAGEDTAFMTMCEKIMGNNYVQYHVSNILRVHNRRHPRKRMYILNENNPQGFCDERKGDWWVELEQKSKYNLNNLFNQVKFETV